MLCTTRGGKCKLVIGTSYRRKGDWVANWHHNSALIASPAIPDLTLIGQIDANEMPITPVWLLAFWGGPRISIGRRNDSDSFERVDPHDSQTLSFQGLSCTARETRQSQEDQGGQVLASLVGRATLTCRVKIWMHESRWGVIPSGHHHDSRVKRLPLILLTARPGCTRAKSGKEQSQTKQTGTSTVHSRLCWEWDRCL